MPQDWQAAGAGEPDQELRLRGGDRGEEVPAVEAAVDQHQHGLIQQGQQLPRLARLPLGSRAEDRAEQRPGTCLHQGHQREPRVAGLPVGRLLLAQPRRGSSPYRAP